jgi:NTE family protein
MREMRSMHFISKLIDDGLVAPGKLKRLHVHMIEDEAVFSDLGWSSKLNTDRDFLEHLFTAGRKCADKWVEKNFDKINKQTTASVMEEFV